MILNKDPCDLTKMKRKGKLNVYSRVELTNKNNQRILSSISYVKHIYFVFK